jgi:dihydrofolate reductase
MIRFIAALDNKQGIADDHGIPWQGRTPTDVHYYRDKMKNGTVLMGYGLYRELSKPYPGGVNYVATRNKEEKLREGFEPVYDARQFLQDQGGDVWNAGGAAIFASTMDMADELYITQLQEDFNCTKFFPEYKNEFTMVSESEPVTENGITYTFQVWKRK